MSASVYPAGRGTSMLKPSDSRPPTSFTFCTVQDGRTVSHNNSHLLAAAQRQLCLSQGTGDSLGMIEAATVFGCRSKLLASDDAALTLHCWHTSRVPHYWYTCCVPQTAACISNNTYRRVDPRRVHRDEQHLLIIAKNCLRAVAMVDLQIKRSSTVNAVRTTMTAEWYRSVPQSVDDVPKTKKTVAAADLPPLLSLCLHFKLPLLESSIHSRQSPGWPPC